jgi:hypothetical protein
MEEDNSYQWEALGTPSSAFMMTRAGRSSSLSPVPTKNRPLYCTRGVKSGLEALGSQLQAPCEGSFQRTLAALEARTTMASPDAESHWRPVVPWKHKSRAGVGLVSPIKSVDAEDMAIPPAAAPHYPRCPTGLSSHKVHDAEPGRHNAESERALKLDISGLATLNSPPSDFRMTRAPATWSRTMARTVATPEPWTPGRHFPEIDLLSYATSPGDGWYKAGGWGAGPRHLHAMSDEYIYGRVVGQSLRMAPSHLSSQVRQKRPEVHTHTHTYTHTHTLSLSLSLSLSPTHTHAHAHTHAPTHKNTLTLARARTPPPIPPPPHTHLEP